MKLVVTGALGHIGSRLIRDLPELQPDLEVVLVDNMLSQRYSSLFNLPARARYKFIEADVTKTDLRAILTGADVVIHLAAITDATSSFDNKDIVEQNNFEATRRVAEAAGEAGSALIHLSSTSVYGMQTTVVDEDCDAAGLRPQSPYAETKLKEEALVKEMSAAGLKAVICRFGTIFGPSPGMRFHTAVNKFCWQAVMGQPLTVWKTAYDQRRPYLDLGDAVRAISFFIERDLFDGRIYNVLTQNATVREVVDHVRPHVPDLNVQFVNSQIMNQLSYDVSNARLRAAGFRFSGDMKAGIAETIGLLKRSNVLSDM